MINWEFYILHHNNKYIYNFRHFYFLCCIKFHHDHASSLIRPALSFPRALQMSLQFTFMYILRLVDLIQIRPCFRPEEWLCPIPWRVKWRARWAQVNPIDVINNSWIIHLIYEVNPGQMRRVRIYWLYGKYSGLP